MIHPSPLRRWALAAAVVGALSTTAARADDVDVNLHNKVLQGKGKPSLTVTAETRIDKVTVELQGGDHPVRFEAGPLKAGAHKTFELDPGARAVHYKGTLTVHYPPREQKDDVGMDLDFEAEVVRPAAVVVKPEDLDLTARRMTFTSTRPTAKASASFTSEDGVDLGTTETDFHGQPAGTPLTLEWPAKAGNVMKIHFEVADPDGFFVGLDLFPWRVDVPHEEVSFPTGSSAIPPTEEPKLDKSLANVVQAIHRSGQFADLHLYVAGHTDTVGNDETNQKLSEARARSIANFFRTHGVHIPIYYDGLGSHALAVPTADQVDEPKNRRAEYIIAITDPAIAHATGPSRWKKL